MPLQSVRISVVSPDQSATGKWPPFSIDTLYTVLFSLLLLVRLVSRSCSPSLSFHSIPLYAQLTLVDLDWNVMAHAQRSIFIYGRNRQVHILLHQIWRADSSIRSWQLVLALRVARNGIAYSVVMFSIHLPTSRRYVPSHSNRTLLRKCRQQYLRKRS
jgi:hypothetical protein